MKLKRKRAEAKAVMEANGDVVTEEVFPFDIEVGEPHSRVVAELSYRKARFFQSVGMTVSVELPTPTGSEKKGLDLASKIVKDAIGRYEDEVNSTLEILVKDWEANQ